MPSSSSTGSAAARGSRSNLNARCGHHETVANTETSPVSVPSTRHEGAAPAGTSCLRVAGGATAGCAR